MNDGPLTCLALLGVITMLWGISTILARIATALEKIAAKEGMSAEASVVGRIRDEH